MMYSLRFPQKDIMFPTGKERIEQQRIISHWPLHVVAYSLAVSSSGFIINK